MNLIYRYIQSHFPCWFLSFCWNVSSFFLEGLNLFWWLLSFLNRTLSRSQWVIFAEAWSWCYLNITTKTKTRNFKKTRLPIPCWIIPWEISKLSNQWDPGPTLKHGLIFNIRFVFFKHTKSSCFALPELKNPFNINRCKTWRT